LRASPLGLPRSSYLLASVACDLSRSTSMRIASRACSGCWADRRHLRCHTARARGPTTAPIPVATTGAKRSPPRVTRPAAAPSSAPKMLAASFAERRSRRLSAEVRVTAGAIRCAMPSASPPPNATPTTDSNCSGPFRQSCPSQRSSSLSWLIGSESRLDGDRYSAAAQFRGRLAPWLRIELTLLIPGNQLMPKKPPRPAQRARLRSG
jgi:hypothetical protein